MRKEYYVLKASGELFENKPLLGWVSQNRVGEGYIIHHPRVVTDDLREAKIYCVDGSENDDMHELKFDYKMYSKKMSNVEVHILRGIKCDAPSLLGDLSSVDVGDCE